jgi:hypothetical protein
MPSSKATTWTRRIRNRSSRAAAELDALIVDIRISTDGRAPDDVAREMRGGAGWLAVSD